MDAKLRQRYEQYQIIMRLLDEHLPSKGFHVSTTVKEVTFEGDTWERYLQGDERENLVREFLDLPTVQKDREEADRLVREIQAKARERPA